MLLVVSLRGRNHQYRHGLHLLRPRSGQSLRGDPHQQHRTVLLVDLGGDLPARRRTGHAENRRQRGDDCRRSGVAELVEIEVELLFRNKLRLAWIIR